ncbi:hypothetical protein AN639_04045 [Candidatus Epulonipiscium fishelsonii]|uniref:Uncharacterized protein n=1 Tax=Candidatus Epulonipiscium fishelsonii TaxID=77094 RepID=A0ACC8X7S9_9FIRM|nr:hypothetical protein AN396_11735 [Epulopiscium sp. SCG-B11WGA-EpuloA1]ONI41144.1 hypothetical protein AN639_04045 [Epulopiscium sp. SCG-B05WGA-EpuloA1]
MKIAILGCGTVGSGACKLLIQNASEIAKRAGEEIVIKKVLARTPKKAYDAGLDKSQICTSFEEILNDDEISLVIEAMGGIDFAYDCIIKSMEKGKNVITANKDLIAIKGKEIFETAERNNVDIMFEASVGGGIPVIGVIKNMLCGNKFSYIMGILNGTTNYILTKMDKERLSYDEALAEAMALGYAEPDPTADVEGLDPARKIAILASLGFNAICTLDEVYSEGITKIESSDIDIAKHYGYVIKLVALAKEKNGEIVLFVRPVFIPKSHPLASVNDSFNAVVIKADAIDEMMLYGRGAGSLPTASSIVGDVMAIAKNISTKTTGKDPYKFYNTKKVVSVNSIDSNFVVRLDIADEPNSLANVTKAFAKENISIKTILQPIKEENQASNLIIITHKTKEKNIESAVQKLQNSECVRKVKMFMCFDSIDDI